MFIAALRRNVLSLSLFHSLFGEAPKSAREGACAPQMEIGAFAECGRNFDEMTRRYETATSRASDAGEGATIRLVFAVAYCRRNFFT